MAFTYPQVNVNGNDYSSYITQDDADLYLGANIGAASWNAAADDTKGAAIISAVRWLDTAPWEGTKTDAANALQWPRSGIPVEGNIPAPDANTLPSQLIQATAELAAALVETPDLRTSLNSPTPSSLRAGPVSISFFRPTFPFDVQVTTLFPANIMALIGQWLGLASGAGGPTAKGTCRKSEIDKPHGFYHGI